MTMRIATAEWADPAEVEERYLYHDGTIWLGRSASEHQTPLGYRDDRHVCLVGGSRGGKGTTGIIPTLLTWPGSICVVDPKGENATITAARRGGGSQHSKGMGQTVKVLDPFQSAQVDDSLRGRFNPLDALDPGNEETIDEAGRIADALVVIHEGGTNDPFWDESARAMVKGIILHVLTSRHYEGRRNLITVRKLILRGDWEAVQQLEADGEEKIPSGQGLLWIGLQKNPAFDGLVAGIGDSFLNMLLNGERQYDSVVQVANRNTEFIDSPAMQRLLGASDFQLSELKTRPEGLSLYLCLPQRYMSTHYRWLRMMIALTVTEMEKVRGRPATGHPILMMLDEFAGLKKMEVLENAVAQLAGFGVKMFFVLQSLEQLKGTYKDNWETFLANSGLKVFFNLEDNFSRDYVSRLIGETEVVREVRSSNESVSESESTSRGTSRSQSESRGRSSSSGTSESEGTNSSTSTGKSWGVNSSENRSQNYSYAQGAIFRRYDKEKIGDSRSQSQGKSRGWTEGESHGASHGTSRSQNEGTSETLGTGTSETEGDTRGSSQSRTSGASETIQKRALVTPDEIGLVFSRIDDRAHTAYPGLALVVISGARPVALRRVNYYEDFLFMGLFDPHPDHPFTGPKELTVDGANIGVLFLSLFKPLNLSVTEWRIKPGQMVMAGEPALVVGTKGGAASARITVPRAGMVVEVPGQNNAMPEGPLFSMLYYEDGAAVLDPFAELAEYFGKFRTLLEKHERDLNSSIGKMKLWIGIATALLALVVAIAGSVTGSGIIVALALVAYFVMVIPKERELRDARDNLKNFSEFA
jgi:type IV secretory pathway TraG/TraD family ATPase VirD4